MVSVALARAALVSATTANLLPKAALTNLTNLTNLLPKLVHLRLHQPLLRLRRLLLAQKLCLRLADTSSKTYLTILVAGLKTGKL